MKLRRNLGLLEVLGLSIAIIAPTMAMAFNVALTAGSAGAATPLTFVIGTVVMAIVALSFVAFSRRVSHAGAAYAYIGSAFGRRAGFVAGWAMLLVYLTFGSGTIVLVGSFLDAAASNYGLHITGLSEIISIAALLLAIVLAFRDMKFATRLMLVLEGISVAAIIVLGIVILSQAAGQGRLTGTPFHPAPGFGWSGIGYGMVFAVLSFAGFEGVATLAEESNNPRRNIPLALIGTIVIGGLFYVFASYAEVIGFGVDHTKDLAGDASPLNTLGLRYISRGFGSAIAVAAAISAFSGCLGCLSAASRIMFAIGRGGFGAWAADVHPRHGTPGRAVLVSGGLALAGILFWDSFVGASNYYGWISTIGVLALILVYLGVTVAETIHAFSHRKPLWGIFGLLGSLLLLWPLYSSVYPVQAYPANLWPYVVVLWLLIGAGIAVLRPEVGETYDALKAVAEDA